MPTIEKHSAHTNFENGKKHKIDMDGSVMGATLRLSPHITIFDKDVFNIPAGSTINSVTVKFLGWQYRSNTNLYAARWGLKDIRHHVGWDGVYGSFNEYSSRLKNGEFSLITDYSVASRTHETGKMNGKGAYIKKDIEVLEKAIKTKALDRALEAKIPEDIYEEIRKKIN